MSARNEPYSGIMAGETLPKVALVGTSNDFDWILPIVDSNVTDAIAENEDIAYRFNGDFIGLGSTYRPTHYRHPGTLYMDVTSKLKCNRCRWFELRLFYSNTDSCYIIHFAGRTIVTGEIQRFRMERAVTAYELIEILSAKTSHGQESRNDPNYVPHITAPGLRALSQAAGFDDDIRDAFNARRAKL